MSGKIDDNKISRRDFIAKSLKVGGGVLLGATLGPLLEACGVKKDNNSSSQTTTITWSFWGDPWTIPIYMQVKTMFEEKYPHIRVQTQQDPFSSYFDKLQTQWAGGTSPDVMYINNVPSYASKGVLMDITDRIKQLNFNINSYFPNELANFQYKGRLYGLPKDNDTKVFFYNKKLFDEAHISYPKQGWTWDDLKSIATALTKTQDGVTSQYGVAIEPSLWTLWVEANDGKVFDNPVNPSKCLVNEPNSVAALEFLYDLMNKSKVTPPYDIQKSSSTYGPLFQSGRLGMCLGNHALIPNFEKITNFDWDIVGFPVSKGKPHINNIGGAGYSIYSKTTNLEAAWTLWSFLCGKEVQEIFAKSNIVVPASQWGLDALGSMQTKYNARIFVDETKVGVPNQLSQQWPKVDQASKIFGSVFEKMWIGKSSPSEAVTEVVPKINALIQGS